MKLLEKLNRVLNEVLPGIEEQLGIRIGQSLSHKRSGRTGHITNISNDKSMVTIKYHGEDGEEKEYPIDRVKQHFIAYRNFKKGVSHEIT